MKMLPNLIFFFLILLVPDVIVWLGLVPDTGMGAKVLCSAATVIVLLSMLALFVRRIGRLRRMRLFFLCFLMLALPKLLFALLGWPFGRCVGIVAALLLMAVFAYGFLWGWLRLKVRQEVMTSSQLPQAFDGYRVLQFSDLHIGTFIRHPWFIDVLVTEIRAQKPDLVVFTGDLVNHKAREVASFMNVLRRVTAPDGVYAVMGNHDYYDHPGQLARVETALGWHVLNDAYSTIERDGEKIVIVGVEHIGTPPFESHGNLSAAMKGLPEGMFKILLSHNPSHWRMEVLDTTDVQLTLSGHTHAAQMRLWRCSPARLMYKEWGGWYKKGERRLYVSAGLGGTVPFRIVAWPEISVITLKKGK